MKKTLLKSLALAVVGSFCVVGAANALPPMLDGGLSITGTYPPADASYSPTPGTPLWSVEGFSFDMTYPAWERNVDGAGTNIHVYELGLMSAENFEDTPGVSNLTGQGVKQANFSWLASVGAEPVSEPAMMVLFGTGLIGLASISRRISKHIQEM